MSIDLSARSHKAPLALSSILLIVSVGCGGLAASAPDADNPPTSIEVRPVTATPIRRMDPATPLPVSGTVQPWKQQNVSFQVGGRVIETIELGEEAEGGNWQVEGSEESPPVTMLARLDDRRFRQRVSSTMAQKEAAELRRAAVLVEVEGVLGAQLSSAIAEYDRASKEFQRIRELVRRNVATQSEYEKVEADMKTAKARAQQINASAESKKAELKSVDAQIKESQVAIEQATTDLEDCVLEAPFRGLVSEVHVIEGGFVAAGQTVVTLTMMDPVLVRVLVSAKTDRHIFTGDQVNIKAQELDMVRPGTVFEKDVQADQATRTFDVNILVRNEKIQIPHRPDVDLPRVKEFRLLRSPESGSDEPLYVEKKSLYQDAQGHYVWRMVDTSRTDFASKANSVRQLERVAVRLGKGRVNLPGQFHYFELSDSGGLNEDHVLVCGVPEGFESGGSVLVVRERWLFRPGDLVEVELPSPGPGVGFYVPLQSIVMHGGRHEVFVIEGEKGSQRASRLPVNIQGEFGRLRLVEAAGEKPLKEKDLVVMAGVAYVSDGEAVRVINTEEVSP